MQGHVWIVLAEGTEIATRIPMEWRIIFDVATRPFDWGPLQVSAAIFAGGCFVILQGKARQTGLGAILAGSFLILISLTAAGYVTTDWYFSRREELRDLADKHYSVVEGPVKNFYPAYFEGRTEESFTVSGHTFRYSDRLFGTCFDQPSAHGGPIKAEMVVRVYFNDGCILRIEKPVGDSQAARGQPPH
jgi:hypothetical protein